MGYQIAVAHPSTVDENLADSGIRAVLERAALNE